MRNVFIIAEAGVNHNGDVETAMQLVDAAAGAGADAVKFQTFKAETLVNLSTPKAAYQKAATSTGESQFSMLKRLELSYDDFVRLYDHCGRRNIEFISTAFDLESVEFLHNLGVQTWKIPSGEVTNLPLIRKIGGYKQPVIVSTGMCSLGDVEACLDILLAAGVRKKQITLLHCTTEYPTPVAEVNLSAMSTMTDAFKVSTGYSDHTPGIEISIAAAAMGAVVIEKHFTLDKNFPGPDHKASIDPGELSEMVRCIRNVTLAMGDGVKRMREAEAKNREVVRKSIVASRLIKKGEIFTEENLTVKRPGSGLSPLNWDKIIGKEATRRYEAEEEIE